MYDSDISSWWQHGIIYQIYPLSFADGNGDGKGDLRGIVSRLDYFLTLGITCIWVSPIYPSPLADFGYDISDYTGIHPMFGTMEDFDLLVAEVHKRGLKLILDYVPNHSSDRHPWFQESRSSAENPKRDWYLWKKPASDGGPPNNWLSVFGGSAWQFDDTTGEYYYHGFLKEQPDLNWRNPAVRNAMCDVLRFWLDKGVDGFRVDVMWHLIKDEHWRDNPPNPEYTAGMLEYESLIPAYSTDQPGIHEVVALMRSVTDEYDDRVILGEIYLPIDRLVRYYGEESDGAHLPLNFQLIVRPWESAAIYAGVTEYMASLPGTGWPNWVIGNHDRPRIASRVGTGQARIAAMLLLTLKGTPIMYYGDEIGMKNVPIPPEFRMDPAGEQRDPERTPMQWNMEKHAGFSSSAPWLPVSEDYPSVNVETELRDENSMLTFYMRLIALRRSEEALMTGDFDPEGIQGNIIAYKRETASPSGRFLVVLNLGSDEGVFTFRPEISVGGEIVFASHYDMIGTTVRERVRLRPDEGIIVRLV